MTSNLTQAEADALLAMDKHRADATEWNYPDFGGKVAVPLKSGDNLEQFVLDLYRAKINLGKRAFQNRGRKALILARLDFGPPHRNPDGEEIDLPHLHLYREGHGDKWAYPAPPDKFPNLIDPHMTLKDFMLFCNIVTPPVIHWGLFS